MYTNPQIHRLRKIVSPLVILTLLLGAIAFPTSTANAVDGIIVVNTAADNETGGDGSCTLREAIWNIVEADEISSGDCNTGIGADTITFAANYTITLTSALPDISTAVTIDGNGAANTIVQASACDPVNLPDSCTPADWRVFTVVSAANVTLKDLTARYGNCDGACNIINADDKGGNIYAINSSLTLDNVTAQYGFAKYGGGIFVEESNLTLQNGSSVDHNKSSNEAGGIYTYAFNDPTQITINNSKVNNNATTLANISGGGMYVEAEDITVLIENGSQINDNTTGYAGGGIDMSSTTNSSLTVDASTISGNVATSDAGGAIKFNPNNTSTLIIQNGSLIDNNTAALDGGGVYFNTSGSDSSLTVDDSTISNNESTTGKGGGIYFASNDNNVLAIQNGSLIDNNTSDSNGGGVYVYTAGTGVSATVDASTISNNTSTDAAGGIYSDGANLTIQNNSIIGGSGAGNQADTGGGVSFGNGALTVNNSQISYNQTVNSGGGGRNRQWHIDHFQRLAGRT